MHTAHPASLLVAALVMLRHPCSRNQETARLLLERAAEHAELTPVEREVCRSLADDMDIERPEPEARIETLEEKVAILRGDKARLGREVEETAAECDALERLWLEEASGSAPSAATCSTRLHGRCVLCVGGRTPLLPHYRQLAERLGVRLIHHDGGKEETLSRLPDLLNASDAVICPTDCVSHPAYWQLKKHCKQTGKPCVLFKGASISGFTVALAQLASGHAGVSGETIEAPVHG